MVRLLTGKGRVLVLTRDNHGTVCEIMPPHNGRNAGLKKVFRFFEPLLGGSV
jgi:hypothetical protein